MAPPPPPPPPLGPTGIFFTLLMPFSIGWSYYMMATSSGGYVDFLPRVCGLYWLWALKNRTAGPIYSDGGVVTFLFPVICCLFRQSLVAGGSMQAYQDSLSRALCSAAAFTVFLNYSVALVGFAKAMAKGYRGMKPTWWAVVFHAYIHAAGAFWLWSSALPLLDAPDLKVVVPAALSTTFLFVRISLRISDILNADINAKAKAKREEMQKSN
eukprot:gene23450-5435_t